MTDYISREAAINAMCRLCSDTTRDKCRIADICNHVCRLEAIPAADVRPVILCRDCQYFENDCGWCGYFDIGMNVNDFCSQGKREES